jgi:hypothetical protein
MNVSPVDVMSDGRVQFNVGCFCCDAVYTFVVPPEQFESWQDGAFVQDAFPNMPREWREMLISSTCPSCWNDMFKEED